MEIGTVGAGEKTNTAIHDTRGNRIATDHALAILPGEEQRGSGGIRDEHAGIITEGLWTSRIRAARKQQQEGKHESFHGLER